MKYNLSKIELRNFSLVKKFILLALELLFAFCFVVAIIGSILIREGSTLQEDIIMTMLFTIWLYLWTKPIFRLLKRPYLRVPGVENILTKQETKEMIESEVFDVIEGIDAKDLTIGKNWIMFRGYFFAKNEICNIEIGSASNTQGVHAVTVELVNGMNALLDAGCGTEKVMHLEMYLERCMPYHQIMMRNRDYKTLSKKKRRKMFKEYLEEGNTKMSIITSTKLLEKELQ